MCYSLKPQLVEKKLGRILEHYNKNGYKTKKQKMLSKILALQNATEPNFLKFDWNNINGPFFG